MPEQPSSESDAIVILSTTSGAEQARKIAAGLVESRLAACVNIVPLIQSIYHWKGKIVQDEEAMLFVKTRRALFEKVKAAIRELHSYKLPEILAFDIKKGEEGFLHWIYACSAGAAAEEEEQ